MVRKPESEYSLREFCEVTHVSPELVSELVGHGILDPHVERDLWYFTAAEVDRCLRAERLMEDLELDLDAAALTLDLMERNARLRRRILYLESLVKRFFD